MLQLKQELPIYQFSNFHANIFVCFMTKDNKNVIKTMQNYSSTKYVTCSEYSTKINTALKKKTVFFEIMEL